MRRVAVVALGVLVWAAPAQAFSERSGTLPMSDGTQLAYDLYEPDGAPPAGGWPGIVALHGLGGSKDDLAPIATVLASRGYAVVAYSARGCGTSTGALELAGPKETSDERAVEQWFAALPEVSDTRIGAWGISYGGGQVWNGLAAGIPYKAAEVVETWTDLYSALWPQGIARSGIVAGLVREVGSRSPLVTGLATDAIRSVDLPSIRALAAARSASGHLAGVTTPVYMFQGRVDWAFDVSQATNAFAQLAGPKKLYVGQFGHAPSTFPGPDAAYVTSQGLQWFDRWLRDEPNGIDTAPPVTIAAASGTGRASFAGLPATRTLPFRLAGTGLRRTARTGAASETFGVSLLTARVMRVVHYPRLVATVLANGRPVTHGAVRPARGLQTIRLANYVQAIPAHARLSVVFGQASAPPDVSYLGFGDTGSITLGAVDLRLRVLARPVTP